MVRRRTNDNRLRPMTTDQMHEVMRSIGESCDPDGPRYEDVREPVVDAIYRGLPGVHLKTRERAEAIFHAFRRRPGLVPGVPPGVVVDISSWLQSETD